MTTTTIHKGAPGLLSGSWAPPILSQWSGALPPLWKVGVVIRAPRALEGLGAVPRPTWNVGVVIGAGALEGPVPCVWKVGMVSGTTGALEGLGCPALGALSSELGARSRPLPSLASLPVWPTDLTERRMPQETTGGARRPQEAASRPQEAPGGPKRLRETRRA